MKTCTFTFCGYDFACEYSTDYLTKADGYTGRGSGLTIEIDSLHEIRAAP